MMQRVIVEIAVTLTLVVLAALQINRIETWEK
jgi:hypothetical protein